MNIPFIGPIIEGISSIGKTWIKGKQKRMQTKVDAETKVMVMASQSIVDWEAIQAKNSGDSWKDEWITLLFSVPLVMAFVPDAVPFVEQGFQALDNMPEWYQYSLSVIVAASFGVRKAIGFQRAKTHAKNVLTK